MNNLSQLFGQEFVPKNAIVLYQNESAAEQEEYFAEIYPIGPDGCPLAGHPLTIEEADQLGRALLAPTSRKRTFLLPERLMPENILHLTESPEPTAIWWTPARQEMLHFVDQLSIPCGMAGIPPMVWKATQGRVYVYALRKNKRPTLEAPLFKAPFFNIHADGEVCMGTVDNLIVSNDPLENFLETWESYFFQSRFSHLLRDTSPVKGNIVDLWQDLVGSEKPFPTHVLEPIDITLQSLLA